ncbi:hypothetical protein [Lutibacter sp.]|uniref:hypothetical protein n=1 Tax=Lutibacter sp. TaxID=1925666 RepID=UPI001A1870B9|nr:hypothetical protein [Lutibacter sp.]MBI9042818.1 hypothetical protein [Lutibacter sp.]
MMKLNKIIEERINVLESILHSIHHNIELLEYMTYNLHKERFNLFNNRGLFHVWVTLFGVVIIDFYKITNEKQKHSFQKILNISKDLKCDIDFEKIQEKINLLFDFYNKSEFETIRSKYLAHQDIEVPVIKSDLSSLNKYKEELFNLFKLLTSELNIANKEFSSDIKNSFSEIFNVIDEYDEVSTYLLANAIKGSKTIEISELQDIIKRREDNAS